MNWQFVWDYLILNFLETFFWGEKNTFLHIFYVPTPNKCYSEHKIKVFSTDDLPQTLS